MWRSRLARAAKSVEEQYASTGSGIKGGAAREKSAIQISLAKNKPGALLAVLKPFADRNLTIRNVSNRRSAYNDPGEHTTIFLDVEAHSSKQALKDAMAEVQACSKYSAIISSWTIPWFPTSIAELDLLDQSTLAAGGDLQDDPENPHPGFHDQEYRARRKIITENAMTYKHGDKIPEVAYSEGENKAWGVVWDKLTELFPTHACKQFNYIFPRLVEGAGYSRDKIPQLQQVSEFLNETTGFTMRPVTGLLSSRDFLNALAFRVFFSTQYIRHHSQPLYTPEPDVVHELMGHAPLFADPDFANFSQQIGLASLGATDEDIEKLARCYWYSVEFGLCNQGGKPRAYGAGLLSSFGELQYCLSDKPELRAWDPFDAAKTPFPITKYQPMYYVANDFKDACAKLKSFTESLDPPFDLEYNQAAKKVMVFPRDAESYMTGTK